MATQPVHEVLASRRQGKGVQYKILREGQSQHEALWVPFSQLFPDLDAVSLILQFHINNPDHPSAPRLQEFDTELVPVIQPVRGLHFVKIRLFDRSNSYAEMEHGRQLERSRRSSMFERGLSGHCPIVYV